MIHKLFLPFKEVRTLQIIKCHFLGMFTKLWKVTTSFCLSLLKPSRCVVNTINKTFTSNTTINIEIHTIKCYKFIMATCFSRPCDHHQANFNRSCAFIGLTIWDPIMSTLFFIYGIPYFKHYEGARSVKVGLMMVARATETCILYWAWPKLLFCRYNQ